MIHLSQTIYYSSKTIGCITKLSCAGTVEWERFYEESYNVLPVDLIPQQDNGCVALLSVRKAGGDYQNAVLRIDAAGNTVWTQRIEMQAGNTTGCMAQDADGSIYTCGNDTVPGTGHRGTILAKINPEGTLLWVKQYAELIDHAPRALTVTSDHKVAVTGNAVLAGVQFTNVFVFIVDEDGNFLKRKIYTTTYDDEPLSICADHSGNLAVTGYSYFINTQWDIFFLKLDGQLNVLQSKFYDLGTAQGEQARYISPSDANTFAIFGDEGGFNERNPLLIKTDADGNIIWSRHYTISPQFTNYLFHGSQASDGGYLMTGDARPANQFRIAPFIKTDANGDMGCLNNTINVSSRTEQFSVFDTLLVEFAPVFSEDISPVPYAVNPLPTSNTTYCQNLVPCGNFSLTATALCPIPCFTFNEQSYLASTWEWTFENGVPATSTDQNPPLVCFDSPGLHEVTLVFTNQYGSTSWSEFVNAQPDCPFTIPNIFTPNGDGLNEVFQADGLLEPFTLTVFNRWGLEVFSSGSPGKGWDGKSEHGKKVPPGVYYYVLFLPQSNRNFNGTITLME